MDEDLSTMSDRQLFSIRTQAAQTVLVLRYYRSVYRVARRLAGNDELADDLFQETWKKILALPKNYDWDAPNFQAFVLRVLHNVFLDYVEDTRLEKHHTTHKSELTPESTGHVLTPLETLSDLEKRKLIEAALASLPTDRRLAFSLRYQEGLSRTEIVHIMSISANQLHNLLAAAKKDLRRYLEQGGINGPF